MKKYMQIISLELKNALIYRMDTFLSALLGILTITFSYLLWSAVFGGRKEVGGFTLQQMATYYLLSKIISSFVQSGGMQNTFSEEIRSGQYSKYIVKPVSSLEYFAFASLARMFFPLILNSIFIAIAMLGFSPYFSAVHIKNILTAFPVLLLSGFLSILMEFLISMTTFKFTDISFIFIMRDIFTTLLSGTLIPLNILLGDKIAMWSPFSYITYYPVMLCMGKSEIPISTAILVLSVWIALFMLTALIVQKKAPKSFEGVGI